MIQQTASARRRRTKRTAACTKRPRVATPDPVPSPSPLSLPSNTSRPSTFGASMWTSTHEANDPSEDRHASLVNVLLRPSGDLVFSGSESTAENSVLIRLCFWSVFDGHGGGDVAEFASGVLLPHISSHVASALGCTVVEAGNFLANGTPLDPTSVKLEPFDENGFQASSFPPRYQSPVDAESSDGESWDSDDDDRIPSPSTTIVTDLGMKYTKSRRLAESFEKPSREVLGTHTQLEVTLISEAVRAAFRSFDEHWINSIDPTVSRQSSCRSNGSWNVGSCAVVAFTVQRLDRRGHETSPAITGHDRSTPSCDDSSSTSDCEDDEDDAMGSCSEPTLPRHAHAAMLYTAHVGDCRAAMVTGDDAASFDDTDACSDSSFDENEADSDSDDDSDCNEDEVKSLGVIARKRPSVMAPMLSDSPRPAKRVRKLALNVLPNLVHVDPDSDTETDDSTVESDDDDDDGERCLAESCRTTLVPSIETPCFPSHDQLSRVFALTTDHSPSNFAEAKAVIKRSKNAPNAIASATPNGIKRVAGSLAVTRALGDAYLKTPTLSFPPYRRNAPYITACPEVTYRVLDKNCDRLLVLASDGVWERCPEMELLRWLRTYYKEKSEASSWESYATIGAKLPKPCTSTQRGSRSLLSFDRGNAQVMQSPAPKSSTATVTDYIIRRVLNKVRRGRKMSSINELLRLPKGRSRRSKHDDLTACVVDLSGFVY